MLPKPKVAFGLSLSASRQLIFPLFSTCTCCRISVSSSRAHKRHLTSRCLVVGWKDPSLLSLNHTSENSLSCPSTQHNFTLRPSSRTTASLTPFEPPSRKPFHERPPAPSEEPSAWEPLGAILCSRAGTACCCVCWLYSPGVQQFLLRQWTSRNQLDQTASQWNNTTAGGSAVSVACSCPHALRLLLVEGAGRNDCNIKCAKRKRLGFHLNDKPGILHTHTQRTVYGVLIC